MQVTQEIQEMQEKRVAHKSEYESNGCKYIVTSYFSEIATETLEDKLVKLESDRVMEAVKPHETESKSSII